jgi:hypothetical protein
MIILLTTLSILIAAGSAVYMIYSLESGEQK